MTKQIDWEEQRKLDQAKRKKAMQGLTPEQLKAIKEVHKALEEALAMLYECQDLYLSDIRKLDNSFYRIQREFNLED